jgi:hypothetical protein
MTTLLLYMRSYQQFPGYSKTTAGGYQLVRQLDIILGETCSGFVIPTTEDERITVQMCATWLCRDPKEKSFTSC